MSIISLLVPLLIVLGMWHVGLCFHWITYCASKVHVECVITTIIRYILTIYYLVWRYALPTAEPFTQYPIMSIIILYTE